MKLDLHRIGFSLLEEHVVSGAQIRKFAAQDQPSLLQFTGCKGLPQDQQGLDHTALPRSVQAAQQSQRGTGQRKTFEALEISQLNFSNHRNTSQSVRLFFDEVGDVDVAAGLGHALAWEPDRQASRTSGPGSSFFAMSRSRVGGVHFRFGDPRIHGR